MGEAGQIVVLNGVPRSGKTSIARCIQASFDGVWLNLGVDAMMSMTPEHLRPGVGLRPGGERPDLEPFVEQLYRTMFAMVAAASRSGSNVVVDVGVHDAYASRLDIRGLADSALARLPTYWVEVACRMSTVQTRRRDTGMLADGLPVERWHEAVYRNGRFDVRVETDDRSPEACAAMIRERITQR